MVKRVLKKDLWASVKITYAFIAGAFKSNPNLCRECFFSEDLSEEALLGYMNQIATSSQVRLLAWTHDHSKHSHIKLKHTATFLL